MAPVPGTSCQATIVLSLRDAIAHIRNNIELKRILSTPRAPTRRHAPTPHADTTPLPARHLRHGVGEDAAAGVAEPVDTESGMGGTNAVSIILEYSIETLPARSILVALAGSAYVYTASLESLSQDTRIAISLS